MKRLVLLMVALVVAGGCGRGTPAQQALAATEGNLREIRSGRLDMVVLASSPEARQGRGVGFELRGPFAVGEEEGSLPIADLEYTRVTGTERRTTRFISTGARAFAEVDGTVQELDADQVEGLRVTDGGGDSGLEGLALGNWLDEPQLSPGTTVDGVATERIRGAADPVAALKDLLAISAQFGAAEDEALPRLDDEGAEQIRRAAEASTVELLTGVEDRLLRHLELVIELGPRGASEELRAALGDLAGARLSFILDVAAVNQPVSVEDPTG